MDVRDPRHGWSRQPSGGGSKLHCDVDDPRALDVRALVARHLAFSRGETPFEFSFALDADQLVDPEVTFFSAREGGRLVGIAALRQLDATHGEIKSMHTNAADRGRGVGRALVEHILVVARGRGYRRLSLETGTTDEFQPARTLYRTIGFMACDAYGDYRPSPHNVFMTMELDNAVADEHDPSAAGS